MPSTPWPKEPLHVNLIATSAGHALTCWAAEAWTRARLDRHHPAEMLGAEPS